MKVYALSAFVPLCEIFGVILLKNPRLSAITNNKDSAFIGQIYGKTMPIPAVSSERIFSYE